uniref:FYVE-type domain-containing protein n=1 Tax=Mesocestoides corti TaxID=53468 RepID=A0A5K3FBT0_MESCO
MLTARLPETAPSTASSSVGSDVERELELVTEKQPQDGPSFPIAAAPPPPPRTKAESTMPPIPSLGHLSLDQNSPSESEGDDQETVESKPLEGVVTCEGCRAWEEKFNAMQLEHTSVNNRLSATVAELHTVKKLNEEIELRSKAEKDLFEERTGSFEQRIDEMGQRLDALMKRYQEYRRATESEFSRLEREREAAQMEIMEIEEHYRTLLGKRRNAAAEMSAPIDLPSNKEDLELYALQMREDLLSTNVSREHLMQRLDSQIAINRDQLLDERQRRMKAEESMRQHMWEANERTAELMRANEVASQAAAAREAAERAAEKASMEAKQCRTKLQETAESLRRATEEVAQLRSRVVSLQCDLETSEKVSKDFVRLSQHLQVQLEKQREQTHELRWQDPEDVSNCSGCKAAFPSGAAGLQTKLNCRHCGSIFCSQCCSKLIPPSGNRSKPAPVCDMCHTLLVKDAAPYFSTGDFSRDSEDKPGDPIPSRGPPRSIVQTLRRDQ